MGCVVWIGIAPFVGNKENLFEQRNISHAICQWILDSVHIDETVTGSNRYAHLQKNNFDENVMKIILILRIWKRQL